MSSIEIENTKLTLKTLASQIERNNSMTLFRMKNVELTGNEADGDDMLRLAKAFRGHQSLREFELVNVQVDGGNLDQVISMLLVSVDLVSLRLEQVEVTASALATAAYSTSLKRLILPKNNLTDKEVAAIAADVSQNQSLEVVDLTGNDFSDIGCAALTKALEKNLHIQELLLDGNGKISTDQRCEIQGKLEGRAAKAA